MLAIQFCTGYNSREISNETLVSIMVSTNRGYE